MRDIEDGSDIYKRQCQKREDDMINDIYRLLEPLSDCVGMAQASANFLGSPEHNEYAANARAHLELLTSLLTQLAWRGDLQHAPVWQEFVRKHQKPVDDPRTAM